MQVARDTCPEDDLQRVVARIVAGDRAAEGEFVARFQRGLTLLVRRHARPNEHRVPDVVQTVLMHALERLRGGALHDATALPAYLRNSALNEVTSMYRTRAIRGNEDISVAEDRPELATSETPERRAQNQQLLGRVLQAIAELPVPRDRELLVRFYLREEPRDAVCAALGIDENHFRRVLFRARERLHAAVGAAS